MSSKTFSTLCSMEHLTHAWNDVKAKKAEDGVDGETIATFEVNLEKNLRSIQEELVTGKWEPYPYLRIEIPKKVTQKRQIGMLTVKDKIVQQALRLLFEPSCEKMFMPCRNWISPYIHLFKRILRITVSFLHPVVFSNWRLVTFISLQVLSRRTKRPSRRRCLTNIWTRRKPLPWLVKCSRIEKWCSSANMSIGNSKKQMQSW